MAHSFCIIKHMTKFQKISLFLLRVSMGWLFLYAGLEKLMNPGWSAAGYLASAKNFPGFYVWLASSGMIGVVNILAEWGLTILGIALILGIGVRLASWLGALLMLLFYMVLPFPYPDANSLLVDEHIILLFALLIMNAYHAGRAWGLSGWAARTFPGLKWLWE